MEKLRIIAEQKVEKARLAAKSKAKQAEAKVHTYSIMKLDPSTLTLISRQSNRKQCHKSLKDFLKVNSIPSLCLYKYPL